MPELPIALSAVSLRLAGEVGQATLDRIFAGDVAAAAEFDQHVAAVRDELTACRQPQVTGAQLAGLAAGRTGRASSEGATSDAAPKNGQPAGAEPTCPDVPFVGNALRTEAVVSLRLLLHYACGFIEAAVSSDWWPAESPADSADWESMRLAAVCHLISQAEAAAELHPDLRAIA